MEKIIEDHELIVSVKFGSHLYGTNTESSDLDIKSVRIPKAREILLGNFSDVISHKRQKTFKEKNLPDDIDEEIYTLTKYLRLLSEGQTVAIDLLFSPKWSFLSEPTNVWKKLLLIKKSSYPSNMLPS